MKSSNLNKLLFLIPFVLILSVLNIFAYFATYRLGIVPICETYFSFEMPQLNFWFFAVLLIVISIFHASKTKEIIDINSDKFYKVIVNLISTILSKYIYVLILFLINIFVF